MTPMTSLSCLPLATPSAAEVPRVIPHFQSTCDPVVHKIISWVDASPYGVKGRRQYFVASTTKKYEFSSHHPSNEWQDAIVNMLNTGRTDHPLYHQLPSPATPSTCLDHNLPQALSELSLNEDDQVRHYDQASGLYLLGDQKRLDN